jgi:hypothetical protein
MTDKKFGAFFLVDVSFSETFQSEKGADIFGVFRLLDQKITECNFCVSDMGNEKFEAT